MQTVRAGDVLAGKYRVERTLGSGGMGFVVEATHLQLGERAAIKFLHEDAVKVPALVERFAREARAMIRIKSEHIARVFDVGELADGCPYMVMEMLEGKDLAQLVAEHGRLPVPEAVDYVLQACEAIAEAHALGIVHRDLKPANLFLTHRADGTAAVKVLDFGISKVALAGATGPAMNLTKTATSLGSPYYMAPEQIASARGVDARADIWSIGALLHELVTGTLAFEADTLAHLQYKILWEEPVPLLLGPGEPPRALEAAISRCLRKKPEERYPDVAELAEAIAPLGTREAQRSAERIRRIARLASSPGSRPGAFVSTPSAPLGLVPTVAATGAAPEAHAETAGLASGADLDRAEEIAPTEGATSRATAAPAAVPAAVRSTPRSELAGTVSSWGGSNGRARRRPGWLVAAAAVLIVAVLAALGAGLAKLYAAPGSRSATAAQPAASTMTASSGAVGSSPSVPAPSAAAREAAAVLEPAASSSGEAGRQGEPGSTAVAGGAPPKRGAAGTKRDPGTRSADPPADPKPPPTSESDLFNTRK
jgi:serine/threonine-protein kinase